MTLACAKQCPYITTGQVDLFFIQAKLYKHDNRLPRYIPVTRAMPSQRGMITIPNITPVHASKLPSPDPFKWQAHQIISISVSPFQFSRQHRTKVVKLKVQSPGSFSQQHHRTCTFIEQMGPSALYLSQVVWTGRWFLLCQRPNSCPQL